MTYLKLIFRDLWFYRKPYLSVLAGVALSISVLSGALIVGDSVRGSLESLTEIRMGKARFALEANQHFFREQLAADISGKTHTMIVPAILSKGMAVNNEKHLQINQVDIAGINDHFPELWENHKIKLEDGEAIISRNTASRLNLKIGDEFLLKAEKMGNAPQNAPFVSEKEVIVTLDLKVKEIADDRKMGRFSLLSNQTAPFLVYVSLDQLSKAQELDGKVNLLLITDDDNRLNTQVLEEYLKQAWKPEDAGLSIEKKADKEYYEIKSGRIFMNPVEVSAIRKAIPKVRFYLTYLVNEFKCRSYSTPYSFAAAMDTEASGNAIPSDGLIINDWLAKDLNSKAGDSVTMKYYLIGAFHNLREDSTRFIVSQVLPFNNKLWDNTLMPNFPGMTNAGSCHEWDVGTPIDMKKIRTKDEQYWNEYRGTPKAVLSLGKGQELWRNPFGDCTLARFTADEKQLPFLISSLIKNLEPGQSDLTFQAIYQQGKIAAKNSIDFGGLFLSLSFFIIIAALLLISLLFGLLANSRLAEVGTMGAVGFSKKRIIQVFLAEATIVSIFGGLLGTLGGLAYNRLIISGLNSFWQGAVRTNLLEIHFGVFSLMTGFFAGIILSVLSMLFVIILNLKRPLIEYIRGSKISAPHLKRKGQNISLVVLIISLFTSFTLLILAFTDILQNQPVLFLSAGGTFLLSCLAAVNYGLLRSLNSHQNNVINFRILVLHNTALKRTQTMAAIALLAIGSFSIIITGANQRSFYGSEKDVHSGTGGFLYWAETSIPVLFNLDSEVGKKQFNLDEMPEMKGAKFVQLSRLKGDDASCLNLNQVKQPSILGVNNNYFNQKNSFSFEKLSDLVDPEHPWLILNKELSDRVIPAFADQSVIQWGLQKKVGDTLIYNDEQGKKVKFKLVGGLSNSIFQGNILVSDSLFRKYFPSAAGSKIMLIESQYQEKTKFVNSLESVFQDYGIQVTPASEKLADFNSVANTYLSVFMMLGGLGILIGTIGLGIVLLRNVREREAEMALYLALGYKQKFIFKVVTAEYIFILITGISIGVLSAFLGCLPSILNPVIQQPWLLLCGIIAMIVGNGLIWIYFPVKSALKKNLIHSLRLE